MDRFVNRAEELAALDRWWDRGTQIAALWGRRRVGKTTLAQRFAHGKPAVFHTGAGRGEIGELALLSRRVGDALPGGLRDPATRPYRDWDDALDDLGDRAVDRPVLLVLDEFPELVESSPALPGILRAFLDRAHSRTRLRLLLCGSAVRYMHALQEQRQPLYGRFDLALGVHPFGPHESALMLERLRPEDRALVHGIVGGMPLYLSWWDQDADVTTNVRRLVCEPGARLVTEGDLVLRTDLEAGDHAQRALYAIAAGKTAHNEVRDRIGTEPTRALERLLELRLVERVQPVGQGPRSRRRRYRIADPFLRFHLGVVARYRTEIDRGFGPSLLPVILDALDEHMGDVWEEAFRSHLRYLALAGQLPVGGDVVAIGPWWDTTGDNQIDAVALAGRSERPVLAGEAKWARTVDATRLVDGLRRKVERGLGIDPDEVRHAVCARAEHRRVPEDVLALTAADLFSPPSSAG